MAIRLATSSANLADQLVADGLITQDQLDRAMREKGAQRSIGKTLVDLGILSEDALNDYLTKMMDIPQVDLKTFQLQLPAFRLIPKEFAIRNHLIGLFRVGNTLTVATSDPLNFQAIDSLRNIVKYDIEVTACSQMDLDKVIEQFYELPIEQEIARLGSESVVQRKPPRPQAAKPPKPQGAQPPGQAPEEVRPQAPTPQSSTLRGPLAEVRPFPERERATPKPPAAARAKREPAEPEAQPVIELVNKLLLQAVREKASDIHFEPTEQEMMIRMRIDGVLHAVRTFSKAEEPSIMSRVKLMAGMDIAEHRIPQDGRFNFSGHGREIDARASSFPTIYGENIVLRLLDRSTALMSLRDLGFSEEILESYSTLLKRSYGMILATGPTGSGKTTTLYTSINQINSPEKHIITIEDPVEYNLPLIRQSQVNLKAGVTFATGLRAIIRQDPDIIMVGEIRDSETASIAIHAALTGHLVFSTLHTNDAPSACTRLIDMGIEPFLISSSIIGVLAQRLVRVLCSSCREERAGVETMVKYFSNQKLPKGAALYSAVGCDECHHIGYRGRIALFELMSMTEPLRQKIMQRVSASDLKELSRKEGMKTIFEDGIDKVLRGVTTLEEVMRVSTED